MDLYLPDEFYALSETPNPRERSTPSRREETDWFGADAFATIPDEGMPMKKACSEPDLCWQVV
jgi:hypothetical protein